MVFLIQSEVANKLAAKPKTHDYSSLSVLVQAYYSVKKLFTIPPKAFTPSPKVMSQVISMTLLERNPNFDKLSELLRLGFSCRRKILSNNLRSLNLEGVDLTRRPEELTVEEWINLL
jgi:16S rRNA (adenine1518-N6/adenine1519-N6)-dimethyltransferase